MASKVPEIKHPRRILIVGPRDSGVLDLLKALTGTAPTPHLTPDQRPITAGLSHTLPLTTRYYTAQIPIWLDETSSPSVWSADFSSPEAAEVVKAVGAWIVVFRKTAAQWEVARGLMEGVKEAVRRVYGEEGEGEGVCLCVGMGGGEVSEEWEDECFDLGFEFVDGGVEGGGRNHVGELTGVSRVREALETGEWEDLDAVEDEDEEEEEGGEVDETLGFRLERGEMEKEFVGLKTAMAGGEDEQEGDEESVEEMERMMSRMMAAREMSAHLGEGERKRLAKRTVEEVMKGLLSGDEMIG